MSDNILDQDIFEYSEQAKYQAEIQKIKKETLRNILIYVGISWLLNQFMWYMNFGESLFEYLSNNIGGFLESYQIRSLLHSFFHILIIGFLFRKRYFSTKFRVELLLVISLGLTFLSSIFFKAIAVEGIAQMTFSLVSSVIYYTTHTWTVQRTYNFLQFSSFEIYTLPILVSIASTATFQILIATELYFVLGFSNLLFSAALMFVMMYALRRAAERTFDTKRIEV